MKLIKIGIFITSLMIAIAGISYAVEGHLVTVSPIALPGYVAILENDKRELATYEKEMLIEMIYSENSAIRLMEEQHAKFEKYHDLNLKRIMAVIALLFVLVVAALVLNRKSLIDAKDAQHN